MLGIVYKPNNWDNLAWGTPECGQFSGGLLPGCTAAVLGPKCEELISEEKQCETFCLPKTKPAGWGRARSPGFDRISLENVMCREGNTAT